jgi:hypothetical protein
MDLIFPLFLSTSELAKMSPYLRRKLVGVKLYHVLPVNPEHLKAKRREGVEHTGFFPCGKAMMYGFLPMGILPVLIKTSCIAGRHTTKLSLYLPWLDCLMSILMPYIAYREPHFLWRAHAFTNQPTSLVISLRERSTDLAAI